MSEPSRVDLLCLDLDLRLRELWAEAEAIEDWSLDTVGPFMRAAYGSGYMHALAEAERGELCKTHHYKVPQRGDLRRAA